MRPYVSVIIPVFNDYPRLAICLAALRKQSYPQDRIQVIVVDNGQNQGVESLPARYPHWQFIKEALPNSYAARNAGLNLAQGEIIAFTDADCIPNEDWIEKGIMRLINTPGCGLVTGNIELFLKHPQRPTPVELYFAFFDENKEDLVKEVRWGATANVFTYREVINRVGKFNAILKSWGDYEWGNRIFLAGYKLIHDSGVKVRHPTRRSLAEFYLWYTRIIGGLFFLKKHNGELWRVTISEPASLESRCQNEVAFLKRVLRSKKYKKISQKSSILLVWFLAKIIKTVELLRLSLGGEPGR